MRDAEKTPEELFLQNLTTIERICACICRRHHVNADEVAEFTQEAKFRLIENDYAIIRKFEGRSSFSTYLMTVITRLYSQYRIEHWGKWRPSAEAKRLGDKAITLERLMTRDGLTYDEAVQTLTTRADSPYTAAQLESYYLRLPHRHARPMLVSDADIPEPAAVDADAAERVMMHERERTGRRVVAIMRDVFETFAAEDRLILHLRYEHALKVPEIAERLHLDAKKIYKRLEKLGAVLRKALEEGGIERRDIDQLISAGEQEIRFDFVPPGNQPRRPSHPQDGEVADDCGAEGEVPKGREGKNR